MATRLIDDTKLQNIAVAIQSKDNGGQMTVDEMAGRIEAIPTGSDFDMTVTDNQVKMIINVFDFDLSFWTRFTVSEGGTVTVDWGDGTVEEFAGGLSLEYEPQRKHVYEKSGYYLVTEAVTNGSMGVGSINGYSTLSEGDLGGADINSQIPIRKMYNTKLKELAFGKDIDVRNLQSIPYLKLHSSVDFSLAMTCTDNVIIKNGRTNIFSNMFNGTSAYSIKIPASVATISANAFGACAVRIIDFTDYSLNENSELPITFESANSMLTPYGTIFLFATQEIAEVAKTTTNLSQYADRIKYVGGV